jgi:hypothetical protein
VIEQYTITTTPKYNFPQAKVNQTLPERFTELSLNSLREVNNKITFLSPELESDDFPSNVFSSKIQLDKEAIQLSPKHQETTIYAVDTSTIKIGETKTGMVVAIRGSIVWKQNHRYHYNRLGPFIFHVTEENKKIVYENLERDCFNVKYGGKHQPAPTLFQMPLRLANLLERWLQASLSLKVNEGIVLFDGSLTAGTSDSPTQRMHELLQNARKNNSVVLAFSKATSLRSNGLLITEIPNLKDPPYLLRTSGLRPKPPTTLLGDIYVARLSKSNLSFRLDIDHQLPIENHLEAVEKLIGNDALEQSYPETLRLAHILCTFTATEVLAIQHFVARNHRIQIISRPDMHRLLFGPFGREGYD